MMRRLLAFALVVLATCFGLLGLASAADAQQPASPRRIGVLLVGLSRRAKRCNSSDRDCGRRVLRGTRCGDRMATSQR